MPERGHGILGNLFDDDCALLFFILVFLLLFFRPRPFGLGSFAAKE